MLGWLDRVRVADLSARVADTIARDFPGVAFDRRDFRDAVQAAEDDGMRAAIVALPNALHEGAVDRAIDARLDILCEKPLALSEAVCARLSQKADASSTLLAVGMVRRLTPAVQAVRSALAADWLGEILDVALSWGSPFAWPTESGEYFKAENAGVLANLGVHSLDLLEYLFGRLEPVSYEDDWGGGAEANATYRLRTAAGAAVTLRFSYTTDLANEVRIRGTKGQITFGHDGDQAIFVDSPRAITAVLTSSRPFAHGRWRPSLRACFAEQLSIFDRAVQRTAVPHATGWDATRTAALIDWAYAHHRRTSPQRHRSPGAFEGRVVVTGGTGFVGSHLLERLAERGCDDVVVPVRSYRSGAAAGRFPVRMVQTPLLDPAAVREAVEGARYVFHLAYGSDGADAARVTWDGTRHVVEAAIATGAESVVVMSTTALFGRADAAVDESSPYAPTNEYERMKARAERWTLRRARSSPRTRITVLNSSCVYGPRGNAYTELPARLAANGSFCWVDGGHGIVNYVYVANLVDAVLLAADSPEAHGERFIVCDGSTTWREFFTTLLPNLADAPSFSVEELRTLAVSRVPPARDLVRAIVRNPDVWRVVRENPALSRLKNVARALPVVPMLVQSARAPARESILADATPAPTPPAWLADLYGPERTRVSAGKVKRVLNWTPQIDLANGLAICRSWLSEIGLSSDTAPA
jgi:nucleoside-diphosphate-sugar epimerase/predicted dehydrogenase